MSILINGLKAPKDDESMIIVLVREEAIDCYDGYGTKIAEAVELPDHGDLIDRDALMDGWWHLKDAVKYGNKNSEQLHHSYSTMMMYEIADEIDDAPVVIPAERK